MIFEMHSTKKPQASVAMAMSVIWLNATFAAKITRMKTVLIILVSIEIQQIRGGTSLRGL
jgi:hypothetical protein